MISDHSNIRRQGYGLGGLLGSSAQECLSPCSSYPTTSHYSDERFRSGFSDSESYSTLPTDDQHVPMNGFHGKKGK